MPEKVSKELFDTAQVFDMRLDCLIEDAMERLPKDPHTLSFVQTLYNAKHDLFGMLMDNGFRAMSMKQKLEMQGMKILPPKVAPD